MQAYEVKLVRVTRALATRTVVAASEEEARARVEEMLEGDLDPDEEDVLSRGWEVEDASSEDRPDLVELHRICSEMTEKCHFVQVMAFRESFRGEVADVMEFAVQDHGEELPDEVVDWLVSTFPEGPRPVRVTAMRSTGGKCGPDEAVETVSTADVPV